MTQEQRRRALAAYTVFDPDDGSDVTYRWHGGLTVNVLARFGDDVEREVDVFTFGELPSDIAAAGEQIAAWHSEFMADVR